MNYPGLSLDFPAGMEGFIAGTNDPPRLLWTTGSQEHSQSQKKEGRKGSKMDSGLGVGGAPHLDSRETSLG